MTKMTSQEIFNRVATHLLTQGEKSEGPTGVCAYQGTSGLKCAIGCLIPNNVYDPEMEGVGVRELMEWPGIAALFDRKDTEFLDRLQGIHDHVDPEHWRRALKVLARVFSLDSAVLGPR